MNPTFINVLRIVFALNCIIFGVDKFFEFLPTCSLTNHISQRGLIVTGVIEIILGFLLLLKKWELWVLRIGTGIMIGGVAFHLAKGSYDISGALIGALIGLFLIFAYKKQLKV